MMEQPIRIGFALTGSFCTFDRALETMASLVKNGADVRPIFSNHAASLDTRFGTAKHWLSATEEITGNTPWITLQQVEPIGPKDLLDVLVVLPCTGNTLAKLAANVIDTPVTMAVKSMLRQEKPVVLGVSTNDGLGASCRNIGTLLTRRGVYFIPFYQDDPVRKPRSLAPKWQQTQATVTAALAGKQIQPILGVL